MGIILHPMETKDRSSHAFYSRIWKTIFLICVPLITASAIALFYPVFSQHSILNFTLTQGNSSSRIVLIRIAILMGLLMIPTAWIVLGFSKVNAGLHKYRYWIGMGLIIGAVVLNISGSSQDMWNIYFGGDGSENIVFGKPRSIRSDEWLVNTPLAFSQYYNDYGYFSDIAGNHGMDMFIVKDTPVWTFAEIFRPFHWGYLLLGSSRGLAFYWSARTVVLFLASYEFLLVFTKNNRIWSFFSSVLITFAPLVQWWYAVNSLPEMIIAMFVSLCALQRFLKTQVANKRLLWVAVIYWCAGMFVLSLYPAWQIPIAYILLILAISLVVQYWGRIAVTKRDLIGIVAFGMVFLALMGSVFVLSEQTIVDSMNTVYPGTRKSVGGGVSWASLFGGIATLLLPFKDYSGTSNPSEVSLFVDLFPLGVLLTVANMAKRKRWDLCGATLVALDFVFIIFSRVGFPLWLSQITLFSQVTSGRLTVGISIINILLLARAVSQFDWHTSVPFNVAIVVGYCALCVYGSKGSFPIAAGQSDYVTLKGMIVVVVIAGLATVAVMFKQQLLRTICVVSVLSLIFVSGVFVNPVQLASRALNDNAVVNELKDINNENPGLWASDSFVYSQALAANGLATMNTVNVTPDWNAWKYLDPEGQFEPIYNRYAFVNLQFVATEAEGQKTFNLGDSPDQIEVTMTLEQAQHLGIKYVLSGEELEDITDGTRIFKQVKQVSAILKVYELTSVQ